MLVRRCSFGLRCRIFHFRIQTLKSLYLWSIGRWCILFIFVTNVFQQRMMSCMPLALIFYLITLFGFIKQDSKFQIFSRIAFSGLNSSFRLRMFICETLSFITFFRIICFSISFILRRSIFVVFIIGMKSCWMLFIANRLRSVMGVIVRLVWNKFILISWDGLWFW